MPRSPRRVEVFRGTGQEWEWKLYGYDRPADLPDRLRAAGFAPDDEEALVVGEVETVRERLAAARAPEGVTIRRLREDDEGWAADWAAIGALHRAVWDEDPTKYVEGLAAAAKADPGGVSTWLAEAADGTVVCAARVNFHARHRVRLAVGRQHAGGLPWPRHLQGARVAPGRRGGRARLPVPAGRRVAGQPPDPGAARPADAQHHDPVDVAAVASPHERNGWWWSGPTRPACPRRRRRCGSQGSTT